MVEVAIVPTGNWIGPKYMWLAQMGYCTKWQTLMFCYCYCNALATNNLMDTVRIPELLVFNLEIF
jgi:hypothetical protein